MLPNSTGHIEKELKCGVFSNDMTPKDAAFILGLPIYAVKPRWQ
jgi:hypothetical protein